MQRKVPFAHGRGTMNNGHRRVKAHARWKETETYGHAGTSAVQIHYIRVQGASSSRAKQAWHLLWTVGVAEPTVEPDATAERET